MRATLRAALVTLSLAGCASHATTHHTVTDGDWGHGVPTATEVEECETVGSSMNVYYATSGATWYCD